MTHVDEVLRRYMARHRAEGEIDPVPYLDEVPPGERDELAARIDRYLAEAPRGPFDAAAFARFRADPRRRAMVERILDDATLRTLRREATLTKAGVGRALASALGLAGHERDVKARYHDLESGSIDPARVHPRIWEALAGALGTSVERVRGGAESAFAARPDAIGGAAFARTADAVAVDVLAMAVSPPEDDVVDRAFFED